MVREFSSNEVQSLIDIGRRKKCKACGLYLNQLPVLDKQKNSNIFWVGLSSVLFTEEEKQPLSPFTKTGALINKIEKPYLKDISFYKTNVVKCLPLANNKIRYPLKHEMEKCYPNLVDEIEALKPSMIFLLGKQVATFVLEKQSLGSFSLNDNFEYDSYTINDILYVPVHHPSFILVYRRKYIENYIKGIYSFFEKILVPYAYHEILAKNIATQRERISREDLINSHCYKFRNILTPYSGHTDPLIPAMLTPL